MSRSANYITPEGLEQLRAEFQKLRYEERPRVTREVSEAAAQGDRSENAEYIYGKKRLREIDSRLEYLVKRIETVTVVRSDPAQAGRVFFGAWVSVEDENAELQRYRIVGPDEFDIDSGKISVASPLARALLGKEEGDEVQVERPKGTARYTIVEISYSVEESASSK